MRDGHRNGGSIETPHPSEGDLHALLHRAAVVLSTIDSPAQIAHSMFELAGLRFPLLAEAAKAHEPAIREAIELEAERLLEGEPCSNDAWDVLLLVTLQRFGVPDAERVRDWLAPRLPATETELFPDWNALRERRRAITLARIQGRDQEADAIEQDVGKRVGELLERRFRRRP